MNYPFFPEVTFSRNVFAQRWPERVQQEETVRVLTQCGFSGGAGMNRSGDELSTDRVVRSVTGITEQEV